MAGVMVDQRRLVQTQLLTLEAVVAVVVTQRRQQTQ
jgi:hypothetical protein